MIIYTPKPKKMKQFKQPLLLCLCLFLAQYLPAQTIPQGMRYQAVARDMQGQPLVNQSVSLQVSMLAGSPNGKIVFQEIHRIVTDAGGLFALTVGAGENSSGQFGQIPWSSENIWLQLAIDEKGGDDFALLAATQLLTVPYAFHAGSAETISSPELQEQEKRACGPTGLPFWSILGNANVVDTCHFIGTTKYQDFIFRTNNIERLRITADGFFLFTGDLIVDGDGTFNNIHVLNDADVGNNLDIGNNGNFGGNLNVVNNTSIGVDLTVGRDGTFGQDLFVDRDGRFGRNLNVINNSVVGFDLSVGRDGSFGQDLSIARDATIGRNLAVNRRLVVNAGVSGAEGDINSYPLLVQGSNQGIAIKVPGSRGTGNNFVSFWDDQGMQGRIEGQTDADIASDPEYIFNTILLAADVAFATADVAGAASSANACGGLGAVACPPIASLIVAAAVKEGLAIANLTQYEIDAFANDGVAYESGAGDYAEWLERRNPEEKMQFGDVVGVKGGKISKNTADADHFMVVSYKPIVLGNMPKENEEANFEKVAFMGQVPVKVMGKVKIGDYILPSGLNDGAGIAKSPQDMRPEDYQKIVGMAWSASQMESFNFVTLAVGINANDVARLAVQQQQRLDALERDLQATQQAIKELLPQFEELKRRLDGQASTAQPATIVQTNAMDGAYLPDLDPAMLEESLKLAEAQLIERGVDIDKSPSLKHLFHTEEGRRQFIDQTRAQYRAMKTRFQEIDAKFNK